MTTLVAQPSLTPLEIDLDAIAALEEEAFFEFCQRNRELRIERTPEGRIVVMSPAGGRTASRNAAITQQLYEWSQEDGDGVAFDSSGGFELPNGAVRSPDAAWVERDRLQELDRSTQERFLPLCPSFVIELRSPSDSLPALREKMAEYLDQGIQLGWLVDPSSRRVSIYRPGRDVQELDDPETVSGDPDLPGFTLDMRRIWDPGW